MTRIFGLFRRVPAPAGGERGNVSVEGALAFPVLVALIFGLIDFGFAVQARIALEGAARSGAQAALLAPADLGAVEAAVRRAAEDPWLGIGGDRATLSTSVARRCECGGVVQACEDACAAGLDWWRTVEVTVSRPYATLVPYPGIGSSILLTGSAVFRVP
jgi:Flp pilus assembly protein TadG